MGNIVLNDESDGRGEIVVYQPDEVLKVEVLVNDETVWLTQEQIAHVPFWNIWVMPDSKPIISDIITLI